MAGYFLDYGHVLLNVIESSSRVRRYLMATCRDDERRAFITLLYTRVSQSISAIKTTVQRGGHCCDKCGDCPSETVTIILTEGHSEYIYIRRDNSIG